MNFTVYEFYLEFMNKGFDPKKILGIQGVLNYLGLHISNTIVAFLFVMFIIGMTTFPIFWALFWIAIWNYLPSILLPIVASLIKPIIMTIAKNKIIQKDSLKHRRFSYLIFQ